MYKPGIFRLGLMLAGVLAAGGGFASVMSIYYAKHSNAEEVMTWGFQAGIYTALSAAISTIIVFAEGGYLYVTGKSLEDLNERLEAVENQVLRKR